MATPAESSYCWQEVLAQHYRLRQFKDGLPNSVKTWLNSCEWTFIHQGGQSKIPLLVLRSPGRLRLRDPLLLQLAESAHGNWGSIDLALFSGETREPVRVLSQTLVDIHRHQ